MLTLTSYQDAIRKQMKKKQARKGTYLQAKLLCLRNIHTGCQELKYQRKDPPDLTSPPDLSSSQTSCHHL
ncbi:hypothetical protein E5288_WYG014367 [Bos mutus]|uniref:Uncharacterized protein n=1 Tax=Bos mutus TaxID=72004 RepID=A0A6B0R6A0_9CETA|nr:hypothetical protein [Bos mutus]